MTYMSRVARPLSTEEIAEIGRHSVTRNAADGITGVLLTLGSVFFQIIEGDEGPVDDLYARVLRDRRHTDIICIGTEEDVPERLFPDWSMNVFELDQLDGDVVLPLKLLLGRMSEAQQIIERYTQPAVSRIMRQGLNPLDVPLRKVERVVLFTDMVGYANISHRLPVEAVSELVGAYLEACSTGISARGGEVTKFLGDGVMAYFDADEVDAAIQSCLDIRHELSRLRAHAPPHSPVRLLFSGFGLASGPVIEGSMGWAVKMDYTIIGEPVNTAARVEALTRILDAPILMTADVCAAASGRWEFCEEGVFDLEADQPTVVCSLATGSRSPSDMRAKVDELLDAFSLIDPDQVVGDQ